MPDIKNIGPLYQWYKDEDETMKAVNRFMVRGAGLLWIPLSFSVLCSVIIIFIKCFDQLKNDNYFITIIVFVVVLLVLSVVFSIIEIRRISILNRYDSYANDVWQKNKVEMLKAFNSVEVVIIFLEDNCDLWQKCRSNHIDDELRGKMKIMNESIAEFRQHNI